MKLNTIGKKRDGNGMGGNDEREQTLNQLLTEMDGLTAERVLLFWRQRTDPKHWIRHCCVPVDSTEEFPWSC